MELDDKTLMVGVTDDGLHEVIVNHRLHVSKDDPGYGHLIFSPDEARNFGMLLMKQAEAADMMRLGLPWDSAPPLPQKGWKIEVLKVWYAVFGAIVEPVVGEELTDEETVAKLRQLHARIEQEVTKNG